MPRRPTVSIKNITFSDEQTLHFEPTDKVILVGPNNSGKSKTLRELLSTAQSGNLTQNLVVTNLELDKTGTKEELKDFLEEVGILVDSHYRYKDWSIHESHLQYWASQYLINTLHIGFIKNIAAETRLTACALKTSISPGQAKTEPQHVLFDDELLMSKICGLFSDAFNQDIFFDFRGGQTIPIHIGKAPVPEEKEDRVSETYVTKVRSFPQLHEQGDGMKSFAGILFEALTFDRDIILIDEPEAFLHPPQMRRLGETLAKEVTGQLFVATHSSDILRGFLTGKQGGIRILRIQRDDSQNKVTETSAEAIKTLWEQPVLRYSNALEGIFHEQTIICEDDSDCRLINSIADHLEQSGDGNWLDTAYVPTGGKHGIPVVAKVLRDIGVPVKAVFDIDFLSEGNLVQKTVEAFGGIWGDIRPVWKRIDAAVRDGMPPKTEKEIKNEIVTIIENSVESNLPKGDIKEALKQDNPWSTVKRHGKTAIPRGQAQTDFAELDAKLQALGIFVVPVGEVENFCPSVGLHGPKFVTKLLSEIPLGDEKLTELKSFVRTVHQ